MIRTGSSWVEKMPDGVELVISQDYLTFVEYNGTDYSFGIGQDSLIVDGKTYTATKKNNN